MLVSLALLLIFVIIVAFRAQAGIWSNAIMLVNVIFGALLAVNYFEPVANAIDSFDPSFRYLTDFLALWGIFALSVGLTRKATEEISKIKVRFKRPFDIGIGAFLACWTAWIAVAFTGLTLHTVPLPRNFLGFQEEPKSAMFLGLLAPDRELLGFVRNQSIGALGRTVVYRVDNKLTPPGPKEFDPQGDFIFKYGSRRAQFENVPGIRVN
jgi:hypothetical protein